MNNAAAIILAAGEGTRMKSTRAKVLHPILGVPMIFHVLFSLRTLGPIPTVIVTGFGGDLLEKEIRKNISSMAFRFILQSKRMGTGHAVKIALRQVPKNTQHVLVLMGDMPLVSASSMKRLVDDHVQNKSVMTVATAMLDNPAGYGRILRSFAGKIIGIKEDRDCIETEKTIKEINTGAYCYSFAFLKTFINKLRNNNAKKEYYLTDLLHMAAATAGGNIGSMKIPPDEANGINDRKQIAEAEKILLRRLQSRLLHEGVSMMLPGTVYIENSVRISTDTIIEPSVILKGKTSIGRSCTIGAGSIIRDSTVGDDCSIGPYCIIEGSMLQRGSSVDAFTRMSGAGATEKKNKNAASFRKKKHKR